MRWPRTIISMASARQRGSGRRRGYSNGRVRLPFQGYKRRGAAATCRDYATSPISVFQGLTWEQAHLAQQLLNRANRERGRLRGPKFAARIAGIVSAVKHGRVGNAAWGWSMHGKRGGQTMAQHPPHHLRAISPLGVRASLITRERRK